MTRILHTRKAKGQYGRVDDAVKIIDPQKRIIRGRRMKKWLYLNHMKEELIKLTLYLNSYGIASIEEAEKITKDAGLDVYDQVKKHSAYLL